MGYVMGYDWIGVYCVCMHSVTNLRLMTNLKPEDFSLIDVNSKRV